jgi:hypothetical protein
MASETKQVPIRFPVDVKVWIEEQARINRSSQNSEVIRAIRAAMTRTSPAEPQQGAD